MTVNRYGLSLAQYEVMRNPRDRTLGGKPVAIGPKRTIAALRRKGLVGFIAGGSGWLAAGLDGGTLTEAGIELHKQLEGSAR